MKRMNFAGAMHSAQGYLMAKSNAYNSTSCGSACGSGDKGQKATSCGSACGSGDKAPKATSCGTACGSGDKK